MPAPNSPIVAGFLLLLTLAGCGDSTVAAAGGAGTGGDGGSAGVGGSAASGGDAGSGGVDQSTPYGSFLGYCRALADCQAPAIPDVFFDQCAASFDTMARTEPCLQALGSFWSCVAAALGCDPAACDVHLPPVAQACRLDAARVED